MFKELFTEKAEFVEYTLPVYWASYLINNDPSGLSKKEIKEVDEFVKREGKGEKMFMAVDFEPLGFMKKNDANTLGGDVGKYTFQIK